MTAPAGVLLPENPRVLVAIITGGRPEVSSRPTVKHARILAEAGFDVVNVVREDWSGKYEDDGFPHVVYSTSFDDGYSRKHWRHPRKRWTPGGFHGAFTGREWAMRYAAAQGYDAVLQMDDNIESTGCLNSTFPWGKWATVSDTVPMLIEFAASTNASLLGFQLNSVVPAPVEKFIRPGYPYSLFLEKVTPARPAYWGPFEDDVMHALDYARSASPWETAAVMPVFRYKKESKSGTGMRAHYNAERGLGLVKHYPENAVLREGPRTSSPKNGADDRGVRHFLNTKGFTPIYVTDQARYDAAEVRLRALLDEVVARRGVSRAEKMERRSAGHS